MHTTHHYFKSMDPDTRAVVYGLLAEYFSLEKHPMTRFDVAHLISLPEQVSYPGAVLLGWDDEGVPVGLVFIEVMPPRATRPYGHEISRLFVSPKHRQRGYGWGLMMAAITYVQHTLLTSHAFLVVGEDNETALSMYKSLGFRTNPDAKERGSKGVEYMELSLSPADSARPSPPLRFRLGARVQMRHDKAQGRVSSARLLQKAI